ncbi:MAG: ubiquinol-cytochrome c reductase [Cellvibrionales bacterium]|nr:ubiquinol-cytochrome c reductase [Cellvibrionales bacterium]
MNALKSLWGWFDARMPGLKHQWKYHMAEYYAPKNFNFWYFFGVLSLLVLVIQLGTGIWLLMSYEASAERAFASVEYIMRDVEMGWLIRYMHSTGASAFFFVVYMHMFRGLIYGSYRAPRELVWIFGMTIYVVLMAEAFLGYVLPWGQMSYWGAQVIISLFGAIPFWGEGIVEWIRGDYLISGITLNRFMSLHVVALPIILLALVVLHILALHEVGSNNPDGVEIKATKDERGVPLDGVPFFPYYLPVHDLLPIIVFLFVFCAIMFFAPEMGGYFLEYANFEEANPLKTPEHIAPVWYFTPFYSMLRAVTFDVGPISSKLGGFIVMAAAIAILFVLPWLDKSPVRSIRYKGNIWHTMILLFAASFIILGILGVKAPTPARTLLAQIATLFYFVFFLGMPFWSKLDKYKTPPQRVTTAGGLGLWPFCKGLAVVLLLTFIPIQVVGAEGKYDCGQIPCAKFKADIGDKASLQRGAKWYMNYCYGCHSTKYARFERVADDLGIPHQIALENLVFTEQKIGDLMTIAYPEDSAKAAFGVAPPDLTLVARARKPEWVYTYLRSFYADDARPLGVNNLVFKDVGMPHALLDLQGLPTCASDVSSVAGAGHGDQGDHCELQILPADAGALSPAEFDQAAYDLTNFLVYMGEPYAEQRVQIGTGVLIFLGIFFVFAWLLNREYWRDIH